MIVKCWRFPQNRESQTSSHTIQNITAREMFTKSMQSQDTVTSHLVTRHLGADHRTNRLL